MFHTEGTAVAAHLDGHAADVLEPRTTVVEGVEPLNDKDATRNFRSVADGVAGIAAVNAEELAGGFLVPLGLDNNDGEAGGLKLSQTYFPGEGKQRDEAEGQDDGKLSAHGCFSKDILKKTAQSYEKIFIYQKIVVPLQPQIVKAAHETGVSVNHHAHI